MHDGSSPLSDWPAAELWLVDGYNALQATLLGASTSEERRQDWWRAEQRQRLVERVFGYPDSTARICVVFDGQRATPDTSVDPPSGRIDPGAAPRVDVVFAPSADDWLVRAVRDDSASLRIAVVTADRRVAGRCRHAGATVIAPHAFIARCTS